MNIFFKYLLLIIALTESFIVFSADAIRKERKEQYVNLSEYLQKLTGHEMALLLQSNNSSVNTQYGSFFIKKIPLTELELESKCIQNTANIFNLPLFYQYGIHLPLYYQPGMWSAGFGAWRELACYQWSTQAVLSDQCCHFTMLYHWRIVEGREVNKKYDTQEKINSRVAFWNNSQQVANRLESLQKSQYFLVLFLEYIPKTINDLLTEKAENVPDLDNILIMIQSQMHDIALYLRTHHFFHFDCHCNNFVTDQKNIYLMDFGLSTQLNFNLSEEEKDFLQKHIYFDEWYMFASLTDELAMRLTSNVTEAQTLVHDYAQGKNEIIQSQTITQFLQKYAPWAILRHEFFSNLRVSKFWPYPSDQVTILLESPYL